MQDHDFFDRGHPVAAFLTFRTYGSWLHGDDRGSVDNLHNAYGTPRIPVNPARRGFERQLVHEPILLGPRRRDATRRAIVATCDLRGWPLHALNVRTNHVHVVLKPDIEAKQAMALLKARATAMMRDTGCWSRDDGPWSRGGSARLIWSAYQLERAVRYVLHRQGPDLD